MKNINENARTVHESLAGANEKVLALVRDPETPISEWTEPSLIVLRAVEVARVSGHDIICDFSSQQASPILSVSDFPDNELVRKMARKKGSVAQAELDRREDEERQRRW